MMKRLSASFLGMWFLLAAGSLPAQDIAERIILPEASLDDAPISDLRSDIELFDTIRKGMTLALAQCEFDSNSCELAVDGEELDRILDTLNKRIITLTNRHTASGVGELEPVLLAYAEARDAYSAVKEKYVAIAPAKEPESLTASIFDTAPAAGGMPAEYDVFNDAGDELMDDAGEESFDAEPSPEATEQ